MITDPTVIRIGEVVQLGHQGEREVARQKFAQIWDEIGGEHGDPLHRCTLAHAMADVRGAALGRTSAGGCPTDHGCAGWRRPG
jgi:hypothetical protein